MSISHQRDGLRIELDTKQCQLSPREVAKLEANLETLGRLVRDFPVASLYVTISHHAKREMYHVKTALRLPGRDLCTGDWDAHYHPAFERCTRKLIHKITAFKQSMGREEEQKKETIGTSHGVIPDHEPDAAALQQAVAESDYRAFWQALAAYEEAVERRVARRVELHPKAAAELGRQLTLGEIVEEVFLIAFDRFEQRPPVPLGTWLEELIDDAIRAFIEHPAEERENVRFAQTLRETELHASTNGAAHRSSET